MNAVANARITYLDNEITYSQTLAQQGNVYHHEMNVASNQNQLLTLSSTLKSGEVYEVSTDFNVYLLDPIHLEGQIRPDVTNFLTKAKCTYGMKSFSTDIQWQVNKTKDTLSNSV